MSWGIDFKADIFLSRISIKNMAELEELIKDKESDIARCKEQLLMYASSNPKDIIPGEWEEDSITFIQNQINYVLIDYEEAYSILKDLYYYKEYLEENEGKNNDQN